MLEFEAWAKSCLGYFGNEVETRFKPKLSSAKMQPIKAASKARTGDDSEECNSDKVDGAMGSRMSKSVPNSLPIRPR